MKYNKLQKLGFSLVEVLVASSILGGLAFAGMKLMQNQTQSANVISIQNEEEKLVGLIHAVLSNERSCTATFGGKSLTAASPATITAIPSSFADVNVSATSVLHVSTAGTSTMFQMKNPTMSATNPLVPVFGPKALVITNYVLHDDVAGLQASFGLPAGNDPNSQLKFTNLRVYIHRDMTGKKDILASDSMMKRIPLVISTTTPTSYIIASCRASGGSETAWTAHSALANNLYFDKGNVAIGGAVNVAATSPKLQIYGSMNVQGNAEITNTATINKLIITNQLILPNAAPAGTPQSGAIWKE